MFPVHFPYSKSAIGFLFFAALLFSVAGCSTTPGQHNPGVRGENGQLPFIARVVNLPTSQPNNGRVSFIVEVNYRDLQFIKSAFGYDSGVDYTLTLATEQRPDDQKVIDSNKEITLGSFQETIAREGVLRIAESFEVATGSYIASISISDKNANSRGGLSHKIEVRDYASEFTISEPFLAWDSVHTFQTDKLIPFKTSNYNRDFFAIVIIGGLDSSQALSLAYRLQDNKNQHLFEQSVTIQPNNRSVLFSLPIPHQRLSLGTTTLKIVARHKEQNIASSLNIRANIGAHTRSDRDYSVLVGPMRYIMTKQEFEALQNASAEQQKTLFNEYWQNRDPQPARESNPLLEEFYYRVETANARFSWSGGDGYATDRGRMLILYGPPDAVQNTRRPGSSTAYEIWTYYDTGRRFVFIDKYNDGNYLLLSDSGD